MSDVVLWTTASATFTIPLTMPLFRLLFEGLLHYCCGVELWLVYAFRQKNHYHKRRKVCPPQGSSLACNGLIVCLYLVIY